MLSSKLLSKAMEDKGRRYWFNSFLERVGNVYRSVLRWILKHRKTTIAGTIVTIAASLGLAFIIGAQLIPGTDQGQIEISDEIDRGSSLEHTDSDTDKVNETLEDYEDIIESSVVSIGGDDFGGMGGGSVNTASYTMQLIPSSDRDRTTTDIVKALDEDLK